METKVLISLAEVPFLRSQGNRLSRMKSVVEPNKQVPVIVFLLLEEGMTFYFNIFDM